MEAAWAALAAQAVRTAGTVYGQDLPLPTNMARADATAANRRRRLERIASLLRALEPRRRDVKFYVDLWQHRNSHFADFELPDKVGSWLPAVVDPRLMSIALLL